MAETLVAGALPDRDLIRGLRLMAAVREMAPCDSTSRASAADFPVLVRRINGHPLAYLDNAASSQQPAAVIDAVADYARSHHANVHRGVHTLSQEATALYEGAREKVRRFINAASTAEIVFVRGTTEAINLVAQSLRPATARRRATRSSSRNSSTTRTSCPGSSCARRPARGSAPCRSTAAASSTSTPTCGCSARARASSRSRTSRTRSAPCCRSPISSPRRASAASRQSSTARRPCRTLPVDVQALGSDFYAFSAHKMYGPTGIGVLHARESLLAAMPPWQGGGDMILSVSFEGSTWNHLPHRFEAGTPNIGGAVGLGAAIDYLDAIGSGARRGPRAGPARLRDGAALAASTGSRSSARRRRKAASSPSRSTASTRTTSARCSIRGASPCAPVTTARCRSWNSSACRRPTRASFGLYNTREEIDALHDAAAGRDPDAALMDLADLYRDVIVDHNRQPAEPRPAAGRDAASAMATIRCAATAPHSTSRSPET